MSAPGTPIEELDPAQLGEESPPRTHFRDELRIGVLAGVEDQELRLEAHFLDCEVCREPGVALAEMADTPEGRCAPQEPVGCPAARNALFRYFDQERELSAEALAHMNDCECCRDHFLAPAQAVRAQEVDEDSIYALD
jgi:predicted anti-sigma-YlaC factor YlaD